MSRNISYENETQELLSALSNIIQIVDDALLKDSLQAALFCSLAIPDIAGQIDYPQLRKRGKVKERYEKWYNENMYEFENPKKSKFEKFNQIDGSVMYLIRCKLYHQGDYSHKEVEERITEKYGSNDIVELKIDYFSNSSWTIISSFYDPDKTIIDIGLNMRDIINKLKWNAKGVLRDNNYFLNNGN